MFSSGGWRVDGVGSAKYRTGSRLAAGRTLRKRMTSPTTALVLGIDGGATSTVAILAEAATGREIGRGTGGPSNIQAVGEAAALRALVGAVDAAFEAAGLPSATVAA